MFNFFYGPSRKFSLMARSFFPYQGFPLVMVGKNISHGNFLCKLKVAVQVLLPSISTSKELTVPVHSPLQPVKVEPVVAVAVTGCVVP